MAQNINVVALTGNLTKDPELRHTQSGMPVCNLRLAVGERYKDSNSGEWLDRQAHRLQPLHDGAGKAR